jgi:hypothetical protein
LIPEAALSPHLIFAPSCCYNIVSETDLADALERASPYFRRRRDEASKVVPLAPVASPSGREHGQKADNLAAASWRDEAARSSKCLNFLVGRRGFEPRTR